MTQATQTADAMGRGDVARGQVDFPYMVIKMFSDFGMAAGKPLAPSGVRELTGVWNRVQQLVSNQELSVASARRCTTSAAREAAKLSQGSATISGDHVREATRIVAARSTATAGRICS
ncbi:MAG: hypothetical protein AAGK22_24260 [Acidobacteriota bacterium]